MTETLAHVYSSESSQWELSNKYQQGLDGFQKSLRSVLVLWTKEASALEGLRSLEKCLHSEAKNDSSLPFHVVI